VYGNCAVAVPLPLATEVQQMAIQIVGENLGGTLQMNDDGELTFTRDNLSKAEVMTVEQAVRRWPYLEGEILSALKRLKD
jgi:hypothetical protein